MAPKGDNMHKEIRGSIMINIVLLIMSMIIYTIHYMVFGHANETLSGIILSLAYVPLGMICQILIFDKILEARERIKAANKMNMLVGSFYHEVGNKLLDLIVKGDKAIKEVQAYTQISLKWEIDEFQLLSQILREYKCNLDIDIINLEEISRILELENKFLLGYITNPILDEYEEFGNMIISLLHLSDELKSRYNNKTLMDYEKIHIRNDICCAYNRLLLQWVDYMQYLKGVYPELFVKALINSPFDSRTKEEKDYEFLMVNKLLEKEDEYLKCKKN